MNTVALPHILCNWLSAEPAERSVQNVWMKLHGRKPNAPNAENGLILRNFFHSGLTMPKREDCYTFEGFAPSPVVIRNTYYYHYKRNTLVLKEETTWS